MAKLTQEQKARNKVATQARNAAFRVRKSAYYKAMAESEKAFSLTDTATGFFNARKALADACDARTAVQREVLSEIAALNEKLTALTLEEDAKVHAARCERDRRSLEYFSQKKAVLAEVAAKYQDVASCPSGPAWKSIDEFAE